MQKKRLIILPLIFTLLGVIFSCSQKQSKVENNKDNNKESIESEQADLPQNEVTEVLNLSNGKKIYVRAKIWGISSNHEEIVFSENPITIANKEKDYIFYTDEVLYKINDNTLVIYAPQSGKNIPKTAFENIEIVFKGLKTFDEVKDYSVNYQKYGLKRISIYEK